MRVPLLRCAITPAFHPRFLKYESKTRQNRHWRTTKGSFGFFFFCWIDASSREFTADAIFAHFSERCGFFTRLFCYALLFFFFFAEKESKSMCLSVKKRFRRQEPAVWVSERERESKENLILLNSRHDCWNFCFFPLQHHEASVFFFPIQHILVLFLFLFLFFGHYIFRWPLILFNLPSCSASYCILLLHSYVPAAGGSIPQCPTVCSALRLLAASHCPSSLYNSNTLEPPTDIFSFKKEKKYFLRLGSISFDNCFFFFFFF